MRIRFFTGNQNPEDAKDPMEAPPDFEVRQSGGGLEFQNWEPLVTTNRCVLARGYLHYHS